MLYLLTIDDFLFNQVNMLMFYNVQTTILTFVEYVVIAFCDLKQKVMLNSIF